jgi:putative spermidine/putrescine transport system permease protein
MTDGVANGADQAEAVAQSGLAWQVKRHVPFGYAGLMLGIFFLLPFLLMVAISFSENISGGLWIYGFELTHYGRFFSPLFTTLLWVSVKFAVFAAVISVAITFPFTFFLSRYRRRVQVISLVFVLCVLSLSEVIVAYSWSVMLSKPAGISNFFVLLGFMEKSTSWSRGFWSVLIALTWFNLPLAVLIQYPNCSRLDREVTEAAMTLGASPVRTFFTIVVPILQPTILTAFIILFVFTMGAFVTPTWLGGPEQWMYAVLIGDEALQRANQPFASALAMFYLVITTILVLITVWLGRKTARNLGT